LLLEKLPFFAMSAALVGVTLAGHYRFSDGATARTVPLDMRLANGLVSYARYIAGTFWPTDMAVFYPYPAHWPIGLVIGAGALVAGISALALWGLHRWPYVAVGWFWFLGVLVPVIGLVQDGAQAMADRYMYVPLFGLLLALCWGVMEVALRLRHTGWAVSLAALAILGCIWVTRHELQLWKDSVALFRRAVAVTGQNALAEEDLGVALARTGAWGEAWNHLAEARRLDPNGATVQFNMGLWVRLPGQVKRGGGTLPRSASTAPQLCQGAK
jgi:hypothetical protein